MKKKTKVKDRLSEDPNETQPEDQHKLFYSEYFLLRSMKRTHLFLMPIKVSMQK